VESAYEFGANAYLVKKDNLDDMTRLVRRLYDFWQETLTLRA
jgi:hypothetical protein